MPILEQLFYSWRQGHSNEPDYDFNSYTRGDIPKYAFLTDGIVDESEYMRADTRILFIAKEACWYGTKDSYEVIHNNARKATFWLREVAYGNETKSLFSNRLSMIGNAIVYKDFIRINKTHDILKSVALLNLNKRGGYSKCTWNTLVSYTSKYAEYIKKEIELINPDIIVCCGNGVKGLLDKYILAASDHRVITVYHPSYFVISDLEYLFQLKKAFTERFY